MTLSRREALARLGSLSVLGAAPSLGASVLRAQGQGSAFWGTLYMRKNEPKGLVLAS